MKHLLVQIACAFVFCAGILPGQGWAQTQIGMGQPAEEGQTIVSAEESQPELKATDLVVEADCNLLHAGQRLAVFRWSPAPRGQRSRLDVTRFYNGWDMGRFDTLAVFERDVASFEWTGGEPAAEYLWRVLTLRDGKWYASATANYEVPVCVGDEEEEDAKDKEDSD